MRGAGGAHGRWRTLVVLDIVLLAALGLLLLFPVVVLANTPDLPAAPPAVSLGPLRNGPGGDLRSLPVLTPGTDAARMVASGAVLEPDTMAAQLSRLATAVFGTQGAGVLGIARYPVLLYDTSGQARYPFVNTPTQTFLAGSPDAVPAHPDQANDLAALLILATANADRVPGYQNGAIVAYALLDRLRVIASCRPQLNREFLLSTSQVPQEDAMVDEAAAAIAACPNDPTPYWVLGTFQSEMTPTQSAAFHLARHEARARRTARTFARMQQAFPRAPASWAGAGDAELRLGYEVAESQPFTARNHFRRALALFNRALAVAHDEGGAHGALEAGLRAGEARALAGLRSFDAAVSAQQQAHALEPRAIAVQVRLADYLERAHRFAEAAATIGRDLRTSRAPPGTSLVGRLSEELFVSDPRRHNLLEDQLDPLSIGVGRVTAVSLVVGPVLGGAGSGVTDLSFLPVYRTRTQYVWLVDGQRWCREWSRRRDLILGGQPALALADLPDRFVDARRPDQLCGDGVNLPTGPTPAQSPILIKAVALRELGHTSRAVDALSQIRVERRLPRPAILGDLEETRQNLWRYAGDFQHAAAVAAAWQRELPRDGRARQRTGEIAFLQHDFGAAVADFDAASQRFNPRYRAEALLDEATVLELGGDHDGARDLLDQAYTRAQRDWQAGELANVEAANYHVYIAYNTRVQAGDNELRRQNFEAAEHAYRQARAWEQRLPDDVQSVLVRPAALHNNESIVLAELGEPKPAVVAARRALASDPENPAFLLTLGYAQRVSGDRRAAATTYASALRSDPTLFPAANDLGVLRAQGVCPSHPNRRRSGHCRSDAEALFRQAAASGPDYALARWNLGVLASASGTSGFLDAQSWFAAASRRAPDLRAQDHRLLFDDEAYFSTLDVSKPIPPTWHFGTAATRIAPTLGVIVVLLLLGRGFFEVGVGHASGKAGERFMKATTRGRLARIRVWGRRIPALIAIAFAVGVLAYPLVASDGTSTSDVVALAAGVTVLSATVMRMRVLIARRAGLPIGHYSWAPTLAVGVIAAALHAAHVAYAPVPVSENRPEVRRLHVVGPALLVVAAVVLLGVGRLSGVPATRAVGFAAFVMLLSILTPLAPLDGGYLQGRRAPFSAAAVVALLAFLIGVGIL